MNKTVKSTKYHSPLRDRQKNLTRQKIVSALGQQMAKEGVEDLSILKLAQSAGVSKMTIYRHFPSRKALLQAMSAWVGEVMSSGNHKGGNHKADQVSSPEELVTLFHKRFLAFDKNSTLAQTGIYTKAGREIRKNAFKYHTLPMLEKAFSNFDSMSVKDAGLLKEIITSLFSLETWQFFRESWGLSGAEAAEISSAAAKIILEHFRSSKIN